MENVVVWSDRSGIKAKFIKRWIEEKSTKSKENNLFIKEKIQKQKPVPYNKNCIYMLYLSAKWSVCGQNIK